MSLRRMFGIGLGLTVFSVGLGAGELDLLPLGDPDRAFAFGSAAPSALYDCHDGRDVSLEELADELVKAQVVLLGEDHTDIRQKELQARLLEAMAVRSADLVLGMEFFLRSDRDLLERWSRGELEDGAFLRQVGWYDRGGYRFEYYRPIMEVARANGIPIVGLNVPREVPRAVNRGGLESLDEEQRRMVGEVVTDDSPQHRYLISRYFGETSAMLPPGWFDNMYAAQSLWDVVMARSILADLDLGETMVVVVGSGHVAYDLGIPRRIDDELAASGLAGMTVASLVPVIAPQPDPEGEPEGHPMGGHGEAMASRGRPARFIRSLADYVAVFEATGGIEAYPRLGLSFEDSESGAPIVAMAWPDTPSAAAGFEHGDRVLDVNGELPTDVSDLRLMLARLQWGERVSFMVERDETQLEIALLLFPEVAEVELVVAPAYAVDPVAEVSPRAVAPVTESVVSDPEVERWLVSEDGLPRWLEVSSGEQRDEVHELDVQGRVQRSLFRRPRPDGTVEIRYRRSPDGEIEETVRRDRTGRIVPG